jgi:hypothetical protein
MLQLQVQTKLAEMSREINEVDSLFFFFHSSLADMPPPPFLTTFLIPHLSFRKEFVDKAIALSFEKCVSKNSSEMSSSEQNCVATHTTMLLHMR